MAARYPIDSVLAESNPESIPSDIDHLRGYHAHHWNRFTIEAPSELHAARVAAHLGWWLHCWNWQQADHYTVIEHDPPIPWVSWDSYAR